MLRKRLKTAGITDTIYNDNSELFICLSRFIKMMPYQHAVEAHRTMHPAPALHQGAPGQMGWQEDPPPWLYPAYCFASVTVWTENKNVAISDRFIGEMVLAAFVLRATTKKRLTFLRKKCIRVTWLEDFLTLKWPGSFTALAPPLNAPCLLVDTAL